MIKSEIKYGALFKLFAQATADLRNKRPLLREIAGIMHRAVEDNFAQEGRPRWPDLLPSTKLARAKTGNWPGKILQRSGSLAASVNWRITEGSAVVYTNKKYAAIQNFGGKTKAHVIKPREKRVLAFGGIIVRSVNHPGSKLPARPFMKLTPGDLRDIYRTTEQWLAAGIGPVQQPSSGPQLRGNIDTKNRTITY